MKQIKQFIKENKYILKMKSEVNFKNPKEYLDIVIDMANGENIGYIVFGVNDKEEIVGIERVKYAYQEIVKCMKLHINPKVENIIIIAHIEGKNIILLKVIPEKRKKYEYIE